MMSKQKSVVIADESHANDLYRELCQKLNLSDPSQVNEIVQILASNAPHTLKQELLGAHLPTANQGLFDFTHSSSSTVILEQNNILASLRTYYFIHRSNPND